MNTSVALEKIFQHHQEYIKAAKALYGNEDRVKNYAEDFIQEVYLKLSRYKDLYSKVIRPDGTVSKGYVFFTMKSIILNDLKRVKVIKLSNSGDLFDIEKDKTATGAHSPHLRERKGVRFISNITQEDRSEYVVNREYTERIFREIASRHDEVVSRYITTDTTFRALEKETGIGIQTIYLKVLAFKRDVRLELGKEYLDRFNCKKK